MPGSTTFAAIKFAEGADEVNKFPAEVSSPGAKTIDKYLEEHTLTFKTRAAGYTAVSGELGVQTKTGETTTLPLAATASQIIGVFSKVAECKVTTSGGALIAGGRIRVGEATVQLYENWGAIFFSDGTNWEIIAGEAEKGVSIGAGKALRTKAEAETGIEPSKLRPALVTLYGAEVGEVSVSGLNFGNAATLTSITFWVEPKLVWKTTKEVTAVTQIR